MLVKPQQPIPLHQCSAAGDRVGMEHTSDFGPRQMDCGSTRRRHTFAMLRAVLIQVNVHPFAWNIGRVHRYRPSGLPCGGRSTFRWCLEWRALHIWPHQVE